MSFSFRIDNNQILLHGDARDWSRGPCARQASTHHWVTPSSVSTSYFHLGSQQAAQAGLEPTLYPTLALNLPYSHLGFPSCCVTDPCHQAQLTKLFRRPPSEPTLWMTCCLHTELKQPLPASKPWWSLAVKTKAEQLIKSEKHIPTALISCIELNNQETTLEDMRSSRQNYRVIIGKV